MNVQQQPAGVRVNTFGEDGETEETVVASPDAIEETAAPVEAAPVEEPVEVPVPTGPLGKYRIGNRTFETQDQALEYAQTQVATLETEQAVADAYHQGVRAALQQQQVQHPGVTPQLPPADDINPEELYTDPKAFLDKFAKKIKTETRSEFDQRETAKQQADAVWYEFSARHPALADFRTEVEDYANKHAGDVQAILNVRGRTAAFDHIALKLKARAAAIAEAAKPKRDLPNVSTTITPSQKTQSVTPKQETKKPLNMAEQIRSMKKRR